MKNWKGTLGHWCHHINEYGVFSAVDGEMIVHNANLYSEQASENIRLICDAGNTIQKCGKLPSELLEENERLIEFAKEVLSYLGDRKEWKEGEEIIGHKANELINKITNK